MCVHEGADGAAACILRVLCIIVRVENDDARKNFFVLSFNRLLLFSAFQRRRSKEKKS